MIDLFVYSQLGNASGRSNKSKFCPWRHAIVQRICICIGYKSASDLHELQLFSNNFFMSYIITIKKIRYCFSRHYAKSDCSSKNADVKVLDTIAQVIWRNFFALFNKLSRMCNISWLMQRRKCLAMIVTNYRWECDWRMSKQRQFAASFYNSLTRRHILSLSCFSPLH